MERDTQHSSLQLLKKAIKEKTLGRLYVFHGEENFLLQHYLEQIKKLLIDPLTESFNFHKFTVENFTVQEFANAVDNLPMMADATFVWVDEIDLFKLPEADRERLVELFRDIPEYCTVVFTYNTTAWSPDKRQQKLMGAINDVATVVNFEKQEQRDLVAWIARHFAAEGKRISNYLCVYLIELTGGTMTALAGEISKVCAYSQADEIVQADIDAVVEPVLDAVVFQITNFLSQGQYGAALLKLRQLFKMQQEPLAILGAIGSHYRRLSMAKILLENGRPASELQKLYNMKDYAARRTMTDAGKISAVFCETAQTLIVETDYKIKTSNGDDQQLLELLILQLAQEARNG